MTIRSSTELDDLLADNITGAISEQDLRDFKDSVFPRATNWAPNITAGTWALGDGSTFGNYLQFGDFVYLNFRIIMGSTTNFGSGNWTLDLPIAADTSGGELRFFGTGICNDQGTKIWPLQIDVVANGSSANLSYFDTNNARAPVTATAPFTWANTDVITGYLLYQKRAVT